VFLKGYKEQEINRVQYCQPRPRGYGPPVLHSWVRAQWFPALSATQEEPGRQRICNRRQREANCHLLSTDNFYAGKETPVQCWDKRLNDISDYIDVWCVPCAIFVPCTHRSQNNVLGISVFVTLSFGTPLCIPKQQNTEANISLRNSKEKTGLLNRLYGAEPFLRNRFLFFWSRSSPPY